MSRPIHGRLAETSAGVTHYHRQGCGKSTVLLHGCGSLGEEILSPLASCRNVDLIAPDRLGYGWSAPPADESDGLESQARWFGAFLDAIDVESCVVVAHSLAAGIALWFAAQSPHRVDRIVLLAPFCRLTPERRMLLLRLAASRILGMPIRTLVVPLVARRLVNSRLRALLSPNDIPEWLESYPYEHATKASAILASAAELKTFNASMGSYDRHVAAPVTVIWGGADTTADQGWHGEWLERYVRHIHAIDLPGVGHAPHHVFPDVVLDAIRGR